MAPVADQKPWFDGWGTSYLSYCVQGSREDTEFSCFKYRGLFAYKDGVVPELTVANTNIVSLFIPGQKDAFKNKEIEIKVEGRPIIKAQVWDTCGDGDCDGCCTANAGRSVKSKEYPKGVLIDMELHTVNRLLGTNYTDPNVWNAPVKWRPV